MTTKTHNPADKVKNCFIAKKTILAALLTISFGVAAEDWTGPDKQLHFAAGAAIAGAITFATRSPTTGFWVGTAAGLAKELYDSTGRGHTSAKDFAVTALGAYIGSQAAGWVITPRSITYSVSF
jgi:uncharacterized protein YfiM (DUF2279 family)